MTSARATAIKFLFIHVFQSPPENKWASMHLVSEIRKRQVFYPYGNVGVNFVFIFRLNIPKGSKQIVYDICRYGKS